MHKLSLSFKFEIKKKKTFPADILKKLKFSLFHKGKITLQKRGAKWPV